MFHRLRYSSLPTNGLLKSSGSTCPSQKALLNLRRWFFALALLFSMKPQNESCGGVFIEGRQSAHSSSPSRLALRDREKGSPNAIISLGFTTRLSRCPEITAMPSPAQPTPKPRYGSVPP